MEDQGIFLILMNVVNTISNIIIGGVVFGAIVFSNVFPGSTSLHQHIILCVIGYGLLMSQAVLSLSSNSGLTQNLKYPQKKWAHMIMQVAGSVLALAGSLIRMIDLNQHFNSGHAICGVLAMVFTFLSLIGGLLNILSSKLSINPIVIKLVHAVVGCLTLVFAYITLFLGFDNLYRTLLGSTNANMMIGFTVISMIGTLLPACIKMVKRVIN